MDDKCSGCGDIPHPMVPCAEAAALRGPFFHELPNGVTPRVVEQLPVDPDEGDVYRVGSVVSIYLGQSRWKHLKADRDLGHDMFWFDDGCEMGGGYCNICSAGDTIYGALWSPWELRRVAQDMENEMNREQAIKEGRGWLPITCHECGMSCGTVENPIMHYCSGRPRDNGKVTCYPNDGKYTVAEPVVQEPEHPFVTALRERVQKLETENRELTDDNSDLRQQVESYNGFAREDSAVVQRLKEELAEEKAIYGIVIEDRNECADAMTAALRENVALRQAIIAMNDKMIEERIGYPKGRDAYWNLVAKLSKEHEARVASEINLNVTNEEAGFSGREA